MVQFVKYGLALLALGVGLIAANVDITSTPEANPTVDLGYAVYRGRVSTAPNITNPVSLFLGIPYGTPPVGQNRFRAPIPLDTAALRKNKTTFDVGTYPNFCVQGTIGQGDAGGAGSEDCLKVNIYVPGTGVKPGSDLPVLVYIHGGGYINGNPANWPFDYWVSQSPNTVIVSVYYRLSSLGFLAHPSFLTNPSTAHVNAGILDQRLALHWVQENIKSFGGDPSKVTIMGQSAGASSVELQLVATPPSESAGTNLFRAAVIQSDFRTPLPTVEQQVALFEAYATLAGCGDALAQDQSAGKGTVDATVDCLRIADLGNLARAQDANKNLSYGAFRPVLDGQIFKDYPTRLLQKGIFHHSDILAGSTSNESLAGGATIQAALQSYFPAITTEDIANIEALYPTSEFVSDSDRETVLTGDHSVRCGRQITASAAQAVGHKGFTYRFNTPVPPSTTVFHSSDNWYLFNGTATGFNGSTVFQPQNATHKAFAAEMIAYYLSFVRTGDPSAEKLSRSPVWPGWELTTSGGKVGGTRQRMVLQQDFDDLNGSLSFSEQVTEEEVERCLQSAALVEHEEN